LRQIRRTKLDPDFLLLWQFLGQNGPEPALADRDTAPMHNVDSFRLREDPYTHIEFAPNVPADGPRAFVEFLFRHGALANSGVKFVSDFCETSMGSRRILTRKL
jgi:hypothetical protein